jgi:hypothetical protein
LRGEVLVHIYSMPQLVAHELGIGFHRLRERGVRIGDSGPAGATEMFLVSCGTAILRRVERAGYSRRSQGVGGDRYAGLASGAGLVTAANPTRRQFRPVNILE